MSQLDTRIFTLTVPSGVTTSNEVDLGRSYRKVYLETPSPIAAEAVIYAASESGGTFKQMYNSGATAVIASSISNMFIDLKDYAYTRYMKIALTAAAANGSTYKVVCLD